MDQAPGSHEISRTGAAHSARRRQNRLFVALIILAGIYAGAIFYLRTHPAAEHSAPRLTAASR